MSYLSFRNQTLLLWKEELLTTGLLLLPLIWFQNKTKQNKYISGAGELAQWLGFGVLPEDLGSIPRSHKVAHKGVPMRSFDTPPPAVNKHMNLCKQNTHTRQVKEINLQNKKSKNLF